MEEEGTQIWNEVKYGNIDELKSLLRTATKEEASIPGGRFSSSPLHEAIARGSIEMVNALRRADVSRDHRPAQDSHFLGLTPLEYASVRYGSSPEHRIIHDNIKRDIRHGTNYQLMYAEMARMAMERKLAKENAERPERQIAFGMGNLQRPGFNSYDLHDELVRMIMERI
jgi:hypothetical protein